VPDVTGIFKRGGRAGGLRLPIDAVFLSSSFRKLLAAQKREPGAPEPGRNEPTVDDGSSEPAAAGDGGNETPAKAAPEYRDARAAIVAAAMRAATTPADRRVLLGKKPAAVVVVVPSPAWVRPLESHFSAGLGNWSIFARDGSNRARDKSTVGNSEVADKLANGRRVVGIAPNPEIILPAALLAAADVTVTIAPPTGAVVRTAMRRCLRGRSPARIDDGDLAGLDIDDLVSAMRPGSTPSQALARLRIAAKRRDHRQGTEGAPLLETAVEYGAAREWGLALARDIADFRAGRLPWSACDRGAIFHSDPGCGKSVLAASIARACKVPLIRASVAEFFSDNSGDLGAVIKAQRATFARAAAMAPSILFLDEVDAVPNRATISPRGRDWWLPVVNDLLLLLDSAISGSRDRVVVIAATNRIQDVDAALLRPGRLERAIEIGRPDLAGTINILRFQLGPEDLHDADLSDVAQVLEGSTAAEIMDAVRGARRAARHAQRNLEIDDLRRQAIGGGNDAPAYLRRISIHEAAHAVTAAVLRIGRLRRVRLQSRGGAGGHTLVKYADDDLLTLADIENRVTSILSAGVAERLFIGTASTGSGGDDRSDLGVATAMLGLVHTSTCVAGNLFHWCAVGDAPATVRANPHLRRLVERHLRMLEERAEDLVRGHREHIFAVGDALASARHLSGEAVLSIIAQVEARKAAAIPAAGESIPVDTGPPAWKEKSAC
jgi:hypothetical protein